MANLLTLPPEIRDIIYSHTLDIASTQRKDEEDLTSYTVFTNLFKVNRQISQESWATFSRINTFIRIEIPWEQAQTHIMNLGKVCLLLTEERADNFPAESMVIRLSVPEMRNTEHDKCRIIILLEDLAKFCKLWLYSDLSHPGLNSHLCLRIKLKPKLLGMGKNKKYAQSIPYALQEQLLLPFGTVKGLQSMEIEGAEESIITAVRKEMAIPADSPEKCLEECTKLKDAGNLAMKASKYQEALELYFKASEAMHIIVHGYELRERQVWADAYFEKELQGGMYDKQHGGVVRIILRIKLVSNIMQAYLKLENNDMVLHWGLRSINTMREHMGPHADEPRHNFPAASEWGKIYYRAGMAHKNMGNLTEAREFIRIAAAWLPHDPEVQRQRAAVAPKIL